MTYQIFKSLLIKWLLAVFLFCAIISFSESSRNSTDQLKATVNIEQIDISTNHEGAPENFLISFFIQKILSNPCFQHVREWKHELTSYDRGVYILLKNNPGFGDVSHKIFTSFFILRSFPPSDDDDNFSDTIG